MYNSVAFQDGISTVSNRAFGYSKTKEGEYIFNDQSPTSAVLGDGGIYSSAEDLYLWNESLYTEKLVKFKTLEKAFSLHSQTSDMDQSGYAYGWYVSSFKNLLHLWHYGSTCGFSTWIDRFPEKKFSIIILSNQNNDDTIKSISLALRNKLL